MIAAKSNAMTPSPPAPDDSPAAPPAPRCLHLRSKRDYIALGEPDDASGENDGDGVPFYCRHTLTVIGPDDDIVGPRVCTPGRVCYESSGF